MRTYTPEADARKWYGDPDSAGYFERNIVAEPWFSETIWVNKRIRRGFRALQRLFHYHAPGYVIAGSVLDDWGYNNRPIAGSTHKSNHAFGIAVDVNARTNGRGTKGDMPGAVTMRAESRGFHWGGRWSDPDPMHYEAAHPRGWYFRRFKRDGRARRWYHRHLHRRGLL